QMAAQGNHAASSMLTMSSPMSPAVNAGTYQETLAGNMGVRTEAGYTPSVAQDTSGYAQFTQGGGSYDTQMAPQAPMYAAAAETQATIQDLGVDPGAIARGDQAAIQQLDQALNVDPGYAQAMHATYDRASHGDPGAAATLMAAAGQTETVQSLAQSGDPSAIAAVTAAQSVPQDVMARAISGDTAAQAMVQNTIASSPDMVSLASQGNQTAAQVLQTGSACVDTAQVQPAGGYQYTDGSGQQYIDANQQYTGAGQQYNTSPGTSGLAGAGGTSQQQYTVSPDTSGLAGAGGTSQQAYTVSPDTSGGLSSGPTLDRAGDVPVSGGSFTSDTTGMSYDHGQPTPPASNLSYAPDGTACVDPGYSQSQEIRTDSYAGQPASYEHHGGHASGDAGGHVSHDVSGGHVSHEQVADASGASYMPADQRHEPQHHQTEAGGENAEYLAEQQRMAAEQQQHEHRGADEGAWHPDQHRESWYVGGASGASPEPQAPTPKPPAQPSTFGQALRGALPGIAGGAGLAAKAGKGKDGTPQGPGEAKGPPERKDLDMRAGKHSGKSDEQRRKDQAELLKKMEHERQIAEAEQKRYQAKSEAERKAAEDELRRLREEQEGMS
ncbi:MAG: hypothetical protein KC777_24580, partial [Cyanobacteria bacterium HKST-UBA02]|nr:hypothetical protein [Cyanobacteria bacterium HKST-UBA02]